MTVLSQLSKATEGGLVATWRACFQGWPGNVPQRGVLVTTFNEQIPFAGFMVADELLFLERRTPDTLGARSLMMPFANIAAVKIVDPIESREFRAFGFQPVAAKKEARQAATASSTSPG